MEILLNAYVGSLMAYIGMEYDNIPHEVTGEMEFYFIECFNDGKVVCLPNAAGAFYERFLKSPENL